MTASDSNIFATSYQLDDFDFDLPPSLIAQFPLKDRSASRLLHVGNTFIRHHVFSDIVSLIDKNDLLIVNNTKVMKARLFGKKHSGAAIEILIERIVDHQTVIAHIRANRSPKPGTVLWFDDNVSATVLGRQDTLFLNRFDQIYNLEETIARIGKLPLPPYIQRDAKAEDEQRYQTIFAEKLGAVAAPTAGLHFDDALQTALKEKGVRTTHITLHVGSGTFLPIRDTIDNHKMHSERYAISQETIDLICQTKEKGGKIIACGTTSLRALESAANRPEGFCAGEYETDIFIRPGYPFKIVDRLITNFHLPKTTLLMLVSAFASLPAIRQAYQSAIEHNYRFFSYGDAMLLERHDAV